MLPYLVSITIRTKQALVSTHRSQRDGSVVSRFRVQSTRLSETNDGQSNRCSSPCVFLFQAVPISLCHKRAAARANFAIGC